MYAESLRLLAANEMALESLYREYASQHADRASFWQELAAEERRHASWLEQRAGEARQNADLQGRFKIEAILAFTQYVKDQEVEARRGEVPFRKALIIASYIEDALIERRFFEQLPMNDRRLKQTLTSLQRATKNHANMIKDALARLGTG